MLSGACLIAESMGREADPLLPPLALETALPKLASVGRVTLGENACPAGSAFRGDAASSVLVLVLSVLVAVVDATLLRWLPNPARAALVLALISLSLACLAASAFPRPCETLLRMLPPNRLLALVFLLASLKHADVPLIADSATEALRTLDVESILALIATAGLLPKGSVVTTPVNLFLALVEVVIPSAGLSARLARELMLRDMAACCCCCFANAASRFCVCAERVFFADPPRTNVPLVALITVLRSEEAARTGLVSLVALPSDEEATLNLYGIPSRSGLVTRMTTVFFSGGMSRTVFCSASWSSVTARRKRLARGGSAFEV